MDAQGARAGADAINDNDYRTSATQSRFILETHGDTRTENTRITHVFIKAQGLTNYSVSVPTGQGTGTGLTQQVIPADGVVDGIQHDLRAVGPVSATEVQVDVTGAATRVYEIMLLEEVVDIPDRFTAINPVRTGVGSIVRQNIRGERYAVASLAGRRKWTTGLELFLTSTTTPSADTVRRALEQNPNMAFAENFDRFPDRVYPAYLAGDLTLDYVGGLFTQQRLSFTIAES